MIIISPGTENFSPCDLVFEEGVSRPCNSFNIQLPNVIVIYRDM